MSHRADQDRLRHAADALLHREPDSDEITAEGFAGATTLYGYFDDLIRERRSQPGNDLLSVLIDAEEQGHALTEPELLGFCFLLIIAGNETTTKLLGNAVAWLAANPDQRALVADDASLIPRAVEETLRYDGSTQAMARCLTTDVELHGQPMRAGTKVLLLLGLGEPRRTPLGRPRRSLRHRARHRGAPRVRSRHPSLPGRLARATRSAGSRSKSCCRCSATTKWTATVRGRVHSGNVRGFSCLPLRFTP